MRPTSVEPVKDKCRQLYPGTKYRDPHPLDTVSWNVEELEVCLDPIFDDNVEAAFYAMTRRPPPEYPGHFWNHSGWTYDRGHSLMEINLSMASAITRSSERRQRHAAQETKWRRKQAALAQAEAHKAERMKELQASMWREIVAASKREAESRGEQLEEDEVGVDTT